MLKPLGPVDGPQGPQHPQYPQDLHHRDGTRTEMDKFALIFKLSINCIQNFISSCNQSTTIAFKILYFLNNKTIGGILYIVQCSSENLDTVWSHRFISIGNCARYELY